MRKIIVVVLMCFCSGLLSSVSLAQEAFQISRRLKYKPIRPVQGKTKKRYEVWWVALYSNGSKKTFWDAPPASNQKIVKVFKYENNLERSLHSDGRGGGAILLNPQVITYEIPTFWTGKTWLEEREMIKQAPQVYKQLLQKARYEHLATDKILHWLRWGKTVYKNNYEYKLALYELKYRPPQKPQALKDLKKRARFKMQAMATAAKEMKTYNKNYPARSIMDALRIDEEITYLENAVASWNTERGNIVKKIAGLEGFKKKDFELRLEWTDNDLKLLKTAIQKLKRAKAGLQQKGLLLPY